VDQINGLFVLFSENPTEQQRKSKFNSCIKNGNGVQQCANTDNSIQSSYCIGKSRPLYNWTLFFSYRYDNMCLTWRKLLRKSPITRDMRLHVELVCRTTARHRAVTRSIPEISKNELIRLNNCNFVANENNTKIPVLLPRTVLTVNFHGHPASMEY
jgi:hypothetical protein